MTQVVTALYDSYDSAVSAVNALEDAGIPHSDISIVSNNADDRYRRDDRTKTAEDAGKGAGIGAAVGGVGGLLTGLGLLAIPGVGPVVAAGWLAATAAGAATGAVVGGAAGGLVGALTKEGVPEEEANFYAEGVRRGGTLVSARVDDARVPAAREILQRYKAVDPAVRGAALEPTADIGTVRKTVKRVGEELLGDPEIGGDFIQPLKMQGVVDVLQTALVVRCKFTATPSRPTYLQRQALRHLIDAFAAAQIRFAAPNVTLQLASAGAA